MGIKIDLTGQKIHSWVVKGYHDKDKRSNTRWKCECEHCGNIKLVWMKCFIKNKVAPCQCIKIREMIGKKFGQLTIIDIDNNKKKRLFYWICKCDCGKIKSIREGHLLDSSTTSCGCFRIKFHQNKFRHRLIGKKFGYWTVIKFSHKIKGRIHWLCKCDCGTEKSVEGSALKKGKSLSCGCKNNLSRGEEIISKWLDKNYSNYNRQQTFKGCKSIKSLRFDFYLPDYGENGLCIEFQGKQHYGKTDIYDDLEKRQERDNIKRKYCKQNNIELLEICYLDMKNINKILFDKIRIKKDGELSPSIFNL